MATGNEKRASGNLDQLATKGRWAEFSDDTDLARDAMGFHCNVDGNVRVTFANDEGDSYVDLTVVAGVVYPHRIKRFWVTNTTEGMGIVALG